LFASLDLFLASEATILNIQLSKDRSIFRDSGFDNVVFESQVYRKVWIVRLPDYQVKDSAIRHVKISLDASSGASVVFFWMTLVSTWLWSGKACQKRTILGHF